MSLAQNVQDKINVIIASRQDGDIKIPLNHPDFEDLNVYFGIEPQIMVEVIDFDKKIYLGKDE